MRLQARLSRWREAGLSAAAAAIRFCASACGWWRPHVLAVASPAKPPSDGGAGLAWTAGEAQRVLLALLVADLVSFGGWIVDATWRPQGWARRPARRLL